MTTTLVERPSFMRIYRLVVGLLGLSAIVTELATLVERDRFVAGQFFSEGAAA